MREVQRVETPQGSMVSCSSIESEPKYISLCDIIVNYDSNFDSSAISISNRLLKRAASAYLHSAAVLAARDENCLMRVWRRVLRRQVVVKLAWRCFVRGAVQTCMGFVAGVMHFF